MIFERKNQIEKIGEKFGFVFSYVVFTALLFFILKIYHRISKPISILIVIGITVLIIIFGTWLKRYLR